MFMTVPFGGVSVMVWGGICVHDCTVWWWICDGLGRYLCS